jgi:hypothetical protein
MEIGAFDSAKIKKKILHAGTEFKKIFPGTRVSHTLGRNPLCLSFKN